MPGERQILIKNHILAVVDSKGGQAVIQIDFRKIGLLLKAILIVS